VSVAPTTKARGGKGRGQEGHSPHKGSFCVLPELILFRALGNIFPRLERARLGPEAEKAVISAVRRAAAVAVCSHNPKKEDMLVGVDPARGAEVNCSQTSNNT
jgi:hypothetical protein